MRRLPIQFRKLVLALFVSANAATSAYAVVAGPPPAPSGNDAGCPNTSTKTGVYAPCVGYLPPTTSFATPPAANGVHHLSSHAGIVVPSMNTQQAAAKGLLPKALGTPSFGVMVAVSQGGGAGQQNPNSAALTAQQYCGTGTSPPPGTDGWSYLNNGNLVLPQWSGWDNLNNPPQSYKGWNYSCQFTPQPAPISCSYISGYDASGNAIWTSYTVSSVWSWGNGNNGTWSQPSCSNPPSPPAPPAKPTCPSGQTQTAAPQWNGSSWVGLTCVPPPPPNECVGQNCTPREKIQIVSTPTVLMLNTTSSSSIFGNNTYSWCTDYWWTQQSGSYTFLVIQHTPACASQGLTGTNTQDGDGGGGNPGYTYSTAYSWGYQGGPNFPSLANPPAHGGLPFASLQQTSSLIFQSGIGGVSNFIGQYNYFGNSTTFGVVQNALNALNGGRSPGYAAILLSGPGVNFSPVTLRSAMTQTGRYGEPAAPTTFSANFVPLALPQYSNIFPASISLKSQNGVAVQFNNVAMQTQNVNNLNGVLYQACDAYGNCIGPADAFNTAVGEVSGRYGMPQSYDYSGTAFMTSPPGFCLNGTTGRYAVPGVCISALQTFQSAVWPTYCSKNKNCPVTGRGLFGQPTYGNPPNANITYTFANSVSGGSYAKSIIYVAPQ